MKKTRCVWVAVLTTVILSGIWLLGSFSAAALPPRPVPPLATPAPKLSAGAIELHVTAAQTGLWTVVQWQDNLGDWHDVEGWQGTLDEGDVKVWWVARADLGKGPFRWLVTQGGELVATSEAFYLPGSAGETTRVSVSLAP